MSMGPGWLHMQQCQSALQSAWPSSNPLTSTACVTLVASIINSTAHGVSRLRLHLWRRSEGCLAKHQPLRGKRSRASGFWDGKLQRNPDVDFAPIQAHCWPGTLRFQNHRCLDRISSRWWWSWRHSGRLARRLFPACWRLWLHGLVHNEPEDVQIAREPRAPKRWAWTCYTLWLKEVFPLLARSDTILKPLMLPWKIWSLISRRHCQSRWRLRELPVVPFFESEQTAL